MSFSVVESVRHLMAEYRRFIRSSYRLADDGLREQFERHVSEAEVLVKGPYVTLARDFAPGMRLAELVREGIGHSGLLDLNWPFGGDPLFAHQEAALRRVEAGRNVIVKTGTGSGKTEGFLLPILADALRAKAAGAAGTKAILLYPMNALANDQLSRLRALFRGTGAGVTFALYTGDSETVAGTLGEPLAGHELTQREDIRAAPPDLILTNYKQLEFLLIRRADRPLFTPALRFLVLDEIHSYRGALATELACLVRRLKARCDLPAGSLRCIGTSATVSQDAGGDAALARFASDLFAELFEPEDVIGESYLPARVPRAPYVPPVRAVAADELTAVTHADSGQLLAFVERLCGRPAPPGESLPERIRALLDGNAFVAALRSAAAYPRSFEEIAAAIVDQVSPFSQLEIEAVARLAEAYVLVGSLGDETDPPALRPKLHTFFHGVYDVGLCLNPACRTLVRDGSEQCPECGAAVRPAVLCRTCGQDFVKVKFAADDATRTEPNDDFLSDDTTAYLAARLIGEKAELEDEGQDGDAEEEGAVRPRAQARRAPHGGAPGRFQRVWVEPWQGRVYQRRPEGVDRLSEQWLLKGRGSSCPVCRSRSSRGDVLTLLRTGVASSVSVISTHHLDRLPEQERKLLVFADNRQEAAHQAGYMGDRHRQFAIRHAIESLVRGAGAGGLAVQDLPRRVLETFQQIGLAKRRLTQDERDLWQRAMLYEVAGEFCRATQHRVSLENLALVAVEYEFLDEMTGDSRFSAACASAGLSVERGTVLVRAILDFIRRRRAVSFDFYGQYIDPRRTPWSYLADEPYAVAFPEYELGVVAFMLDRAQGARGQRVSGFSFEALIRDGARGPTGGVARLVRAKGGLDDHQADPWVRQVVVLLEEYGLLEAMPGIPERVRRIIGAGRPLQIARRIIRAAPASGGWRCRKCSTWRPYRGQSCLAGATCSGENADLIAAEADREHYYVGLYTEERPRRLRALEHTAQIGEEERARRETEFKEGRADVLVCSPTLELGVNIGDLSSVVMRNAAPAPTNYVQRAGRAGRTLRIGYVSTFCGVGPHDRHCFEDPAWLVRGEFRPPQVRLTNERIVHRHVRSLALEELNTDFNWVMGDLLEDLQSPERLDPAHLGGLVSRLREAAPATTDRAAQVFREVPDARHAVEAFPSDLEAAVADWHVEVRRLHREFQDLGQILSSREIDQKRRARQRAYRELTMDRRKAHVISYLAEVGLLPSYQFPTDTFSLEPGVADTPILRRPAWIALFEFAPGNMVYANGHKLKSIRAFFQGRGRGPRVGDGGAEGGGLAERFCFCDQCGFASREAVNDCPRCRQPIRNQETVALLTSFEAEENTQITSAEDSRQRVTYERREHLLDQPGAVVDLHPYEFVTLELRPRARLLVTNWGRQARRGRGPAGELFDLCPECGKHRPHGLTGAKAARWDEDHRRWCAGQPRRFVLGYEFSADVLVLPVPAGLAPLAEDHSEGFARTLGKAMVVGAQELLEIEPDEIAYFAHPDGAGGWSLSFYETTPGGAGHLAQLAGRLPNWARAAEARLFGHACDRACYRCLKSYRNQFDHGILDKALIRDALFQLGRVSNLGPAAHGRAGDGERQSRDFVEQVNADRGSGGTSPIEQALALAIERDGRLPEPVAQHKVFTPTGELLTVPDFAYPGYRLAVFCDGFAFHGNADTLSADARKRNQLQAMGWLVLAFWGRQILRDPAGCVDQLRSAIESVRGRGSQI